MLTLSQKSYSGKSYRPTPYIKESKFILSIITPWNARRAQAEELANTFTNQYNTSSEDTNQTRVYKPKSFLSERENTIYSICHQLNAEVFDKHNKTQLQLGFEACFIVETKTEVIFAGLGRPHIYLSRNKNLHPLRAFSFSNDLASSPDTDPLPQHLLGMYDEAHIFINSVKKQASDRLILVNRNYLPAEFIHSHSQSLQNMSNILAKENQDLPFWLGFIQIS